MKTTERMLERIEQQAQSIRIVEMMPLYLLKEKLDHRINLRNKGEKLRAMLSA